ncbi:MAG: peptide chain release factor N(5)-glutamine methyltransferase [Acidobacteriaceae bacterium]
MHITRPSVSNLKQRQWRNPPAGEALKEARARLADRSRNPRLDAEALVAHVLGRDRTALLTHPERLLSPAEADLLESLLQRRFAGEPIQYITGVQEFFGLTFEVSPDVLIPRPETEHLVETVLERFGRERKLRIVDVGTGSGAIAVSLANLMPQADVTAIDSSAAALQVAGRNAQRHGLTERVAFLQSDLLADAVENGFDVVVSNPPYVGNAEVLEVQVLNYEPHAALFAGPTGLEVYERLIPQARRALKPQGWLMLEIGHGQQPALQKLLQGWADVRFLPDLQGIPRVAEARLLK